jgi:septal ring factor EnvC (AmiA/AmiB activator)
MPLLTLLLQHKEFLVILLLLGFLGFGFMYIKVLHAENAVLKTDNATLTSNLAASNASIARLQGSINDQNTAIDKLKTAADEREKANAALVAAAAKQAETFRVHALDILKLKPDSTDKCRAADDLINQEILKSKLK